MISEQPPRIPRRRPKPRSAITPRQQQYLDAIRELSTSLGHAPAHHELATYLGIGPCAIHGTIQRLVERGVVDETRDGTSLRLTLAVTEAA